MVETRGQAQVKPLKKPGAYDTSAYFAEKDEGFGDVGVRQEPDAGTLDDPSDPDFQPAKADEEAAEAARQEDVPVEGDVRAEAEELKDTPVGEPARYAGGEPVPVVDEGGDLEADAAERAAMDMPLDT